MGDIYKMIEKMLVFVMGASVFLITDIKIEKKKWFGLTEVKNSAIAIACGGTVVLLCMNRWGISLQGILVYLFLTFLQAVALVDAIFRKIPDKLIIVIAFAGGVSALLFPEVTLVQRFAGSISVSLPMLLITLFVPGAFGGGDIKLMAACGLFLGCKKNMMAFAVAVLAAGIYCTCMIVLKKVDRKSEIAFGPFLCLGAAVAVWF